MTKTDTLGWVALSAFLVLILIAVVTAVAHPRTSFPAPALTHAEACRQIYPAPAECS